MSKTNTAAGRYETLTQERSPFLQRARDAALLTIPALMPPEGSTGTTELSAPFQSLGARGINNLAAKLMLVLFPPGGSFFRLSIDEFILDELEAELPDEEDARGELEAALSKIERAVVKRVESTNARPVLANTLKHLEVTGNGLLQILPGGSLKLHPLDSYVIKRDLEGEPLEIVVKEDLSPLNLPDRVREIVENKRKGEAEGLNEESADKTICLYTRVSRRKPVIRRRMGREVRFGKARWEIWQEVLDEEVRGSRGTEPLDKPSFLPLRWTAVDKESYGRGLVEEYMGDLSSLESVTQSIIEFAAAASKILFLLDPTGLTDKRTIQNAPSGAVVDGNANDITVLQMDKFADFQVANLTADGITSRLEQAFLLNTSVRRNAERVTAEEIRFMAGELEQSLGGVYSTLSSELQMPLVVRIMAQMTRDQTLPKLPNDSVTPQITTGLEGLGRQGDLLKLDLLLEGAANIFGPDAITEYANVGAYFTRRAAALGTDIEGIIRSEEEVQQRRAEAQQAAAQQQAIGPGIAATKDIAIASAEAQAQ